jgi:hypothetical protein
MHRRIIGVLSATVAAGALGALSLTAASASPVAQVPSGSVSEYTCGPTAGGVTPPCEAGYEADNRDFRYAQAIITVPNRVSTRADPAMYVSLEHARNEYAMIGIRPCQFTFAAGPPVVGITGCTAPTANGGGGWELFYDFAIGGSTHTDVEVIHVPNGTSGVLASAYWNPNGRSVNFVATVDGTTVLNNTVAVAGSTYTEAEAVADWRYPQPPPITVDEEPVNPITITPVPPVNPGTDTRVTQFLDGRFTTQSSARGTFKGPWTLVNVIVTSNGVQPGIPGGGTLIAEPAYLWSDSFANGMFGDAFGLWLRHS